jgi:hypothetical protein
MDGFERAPMIDVLWLSHVAPGRSSRCLQMHHEAQGERTRNGRAVIQASDVALMDAAPLMRLPFLLLRDSGAILQKHVAQLQNS